MWTAWAVILYGVVLNMPLFGIQRQPKSLDENEWIRVILGCGKGTLMELGMTPIITSGLVLQFLASARHIDVNMWSKEDRELF